MQLIDLGQSPKTAKPFDAYLRNICENFEMDYAAYAGFNPVGSTMHGHVTYPEAWKRHYIKRRLHLVDPTLHLAKRSIAPVDWVRLQTPEAPSVVFREASDFGISGQGLTVPVRGPYGDIGMLSLTRRCSAAEWQKMVPQYISQIQSAAVYLHDHVMSSETLSSVLRFPQLSAREAEVLQWVAAGKSQFDVADILGISNRTVEVHLRSAKTKLQALTTPQAVGRAVAIGLIHSG